MREDFLHYIWQYQAFDKQDLKTTVGAPIQVIHPGIFHTHVGPDFDEATLKIDSLSWSGPIEIHLRSSDWYLHKHSKDTAYDKVILHVVWEDDRPVSRQDGSPIPTLELRGRVDLRLQHNHQSLVESLREIPCEEQIGKVREISLLSMKDKALMHRMEEKAAWMQEVYQRSKGDWDEVAYQGMARAFGFRVNRDAMWEVSRQLPLKLVLKHRYNTSQLEALLLGTAGFLQDEDQVDPYFQIVQQEWQFLAHKYQLSPPNPPLPWRLGRLRPANMPYRRLAQFGALLSAEGRLFAMLKEVTSLKELLARLSISPSPYWKSHHAFGKKSGRSFGKLGKSSVVGVIINTVVPILIAYGKTHHDQSFVDKGIELLQHLPPEDNAIVRRWKHRGVTASSAFDSQALIGQFHAFCTPKKCLSCPVGVSLLKHG